MDRIQNFSVILIASVGKGQAIKATRCEGGKFGRWSAATYVADTHRNFLFVYQRGQNVSRTDHYIAG